MLPLVEDVADAFKHYKLERRKGARAVNDRKPRSASELLAEPEVFGTMRWEEMTWEGRPGLFVVEDVAAGHRRSLRRALISIMDAWRDLYRANLI